MLKHFIRYVLGPLVLLMALGLQARVYEKPEEVPNPKDPSNKVSSLGAIHNLWVSDPDQILTQDQIGTLNDIIEDHQRARGNEITLVLLEEISKITPKEMAHELFNRWGVGKKANDNGLLILFAKKNRRIEFETGYGLEGVLPDIRCVQIQREEMLPYFKNNQYYEGLRQGLLKTISYISDLSESQDVNPKLSSNSKSVSISFFYSAFVLMGLSLLFIVLGLSQLPPRKYLFYALGILFLYQALFEFADAVGVENIVFYEMIFYSINGLLILFWFLGEFIKIRNVKDRQLRLDLIEKSKWGAGLIFFVPLAWFLHLLFLLFSLRRTRFQEVNCPECQIPMGLLSEQKEDAKLHAQEIKEENLGGVDYDVWTCERCHRVEKFRVPVLFTDFQTCPSCRGVGVKFNSREVLMRPTRLNSGLAQLNYQCELCNYSFFKQEVLPRISQSHTLSSGGLGSSGSRSGGGGFGGGRSGGGGGGSSW
ncbi:MAG TPA: TPM domain-containing protein [Pseudobdellovibrionaceae bacterium]|nr:TPM domain-containing protein [Pseudobdellovibrionaceae bacterium]